MTEGLVNVSILAACYFLGSIPFGFVFARIAGIDITKSGSGNIGATNVLRLLGPKYAVPVLLLDFGKGALAAYLGSRFLEMGTLGAIVAGAGAIAGHNWSLFLGFKGGKGVAATAGVASVAFPGLFLVALLVFLLVVVTTKYVSLGSLLGVWSAFVASMFPAYGTIERVPVFILACLITYTHRSNLKRLLGGTERKIGQRES